MFRSRRCGVEMTLALAALLSPMLPAAARAQHRANPSYSAIPAMAALPPFPGIEDANAEIDRLSAPGVTKLQQRLILFEGVLAVGHLPCSGTIRCDADRGVTIGCLQFGLAGRLQPILRAMDQAHPRRFASAFGAHVEEIRTMLDLPTIPAQVAWARSIADATGNLVGSWPAEFATLAAMPEFQSVYLESTIMRYRRAAAWAERYSLRSRRGLALMFDLALFRGISSEQETVLTDAMHAADLQGSSAATELRRLRTFASARSDMEPNALLRFHLTTIAEGYTPFLGYALDLAAFGITLDPVGREE